MSIAYPKISVITVVYNAEGTILQTAESIFCQTYTNVEYIIIDGKSTDGTIEKIQKIQHKLSYWVSEKDAGIYDAMNKGIKVCKGDWIIFLGADDVFYNDNVLTEIFVNNKTEASDFIYGDVVLKSNKKIYGGSRNYQQLIAKNINHQAIFYKSSIFYTKSFFNLHYTILADFALNLHLFRDSSVIKTYIPVTVTIYNDKGVSNDVIDGNFFKDQLEYFLTVDKIPLKDPRLQPYYFYYGFARLLNKKKVEGIKNIFYALTFGKRKFYYFLVSGKYFFSFLKTRKKIKATF